MKKRWISLFALLVLLALSSCGFAWMVFNSGIGESETWETYERHYAMVTDGTDSELWDRIYESALLEGKERGIYVERFGESLAVPYTRDQILDLAIKASVDGIITTGDEDEETIALIDEAVDAGIPVVTVLQDSTGSRRQCFVGCSNYSIGQEYARQILNLVEQSGDADIQDVLVLLDTDAQDASQNLILLAIRETLEESLGADSPLVVESAAIDNSRDFSPEESIRDIFLSAEELPDVLVCLNAVYTRCAYQAAVDYNNVGDVEILGYYDSDVILEAVSKGIVASTITFDAEQMGALCVQALDEYDETGYTNNYLAVDIRLIGSAEAEALLSGE
ncbi:MAG: substrate-binding domain-containing protein [Lachnospiraceae bacterium]|nr:substrate-binding domain-containing protein [Lachnospiraceae bacterium]